MNLPHETVIPQKEGINVLSLFDGISCGHVAFDRIGIKVNQYFASEICEDSIKVTQTNYPNTIQLGDVTLLTEERLKQLPRIDILIGGSPCQDLSKANVLKTKGLYDKKSSLFFEYIRIRQWLKENNNPNLIFLLENVKPRTTEYLTTMNELMGVEPVLIDSALVSAQRRLRYYWTNINEGKIPQPEDKHILIRDIVFDNEYGVFKDERIERTKKFTKNYIKYDLSGKGYYSQQDRAYFLDGKMGTVPKNQPTNKLNVWLGGDLYRRGHPIEAERYQTLPDNYTSCIESAGKRIGLCGDGWTVDVIAHIFSFLPYTRTVQTP